jgi:hypothetical protein
MNLATEHTGCDLGGQVVFRLEVTSRRLPLRMFFFSNPLDTIHDERHKYHT